MVRRAPSIVEVGEVAPGLAVVSHGLVDELASQQAGVGLARHALGIETIQYRLAQPGSCCVVCRVADQVIPLAWIGNQIKELVFVAVDIVVFV